MFPSKYIHVGGDEATKTEWAKCPKCKLRIKTEGLKDVGELQSYFIKRIEKYINSKNRVLLGWDEILEGGLPPKATVMSWRGTQGGINAANQGHDVVMTPEDPCYFDHYQGPADQEPVGFGGYNPMSKVYAFNPVPEVLNAAAAKHILGGQANLWAEFVPNISHAEYMTFPRIAALAEALWSPKELRKWDDFSRRIKLFMKRYDQLGIHYSRSAFNVAARTVFVPSKKQLAVSLACELSGVDIHYTSDGSEPNNLSTIYSEPILLDKSTTLKAITFAGGIPSGKPMSQTFNFNKATGKPVKYVVPYSDLYKGSGEFTLVNGLRGSANGSDGQWQGWAGTVMEVNIDLQQATEIHQISVGTVQNASSWIFFPKRLEYFISEDGIKFQRVAEIINEVDPLAEGSLLKDFSASFNPVKANFVKVVAYNLGKCPKGHPGEGKAAWLFVDEISIE